MVFFTFPAGRKFIENCRKTAPTNTLRKLVLPEKISNEPYNDLIQNIENLRRKIGDDYLEIIFKRAANIEDDIIIAVENQKDS